MVQTVIEGISIRIENVNVNFTSTVFSAKFHVSIEHLCLEGNQVK